MSSTNKNRLDNYLRYSKVKPKLFPMTFKSVSLQVFTLVFSLFLMTSCAENKKEIKEEAKKELTSQHDYQCPMDCEKGKTYHDTGSCPVCKMDLKEVKKGEGMTCNQHKDGKCSCNGEKCKCENCPEHSKTMTCKQHEDGKCTCEGDKCACANCPEHS